MTSNVCVAETGYVREFIGNFYVLHILLVTYEITKTRKMYSYDVFFTLPLCKISIRNLTVK